MVHLYGHLKGKIWETFLLMISLRKQWVIYYQLFSEYSIMNISLFLVLNVLLWSLFPLERYFVTAEWVVEKKIAL